MKVVEILNAYPGETFIGEHAKAIVGYTDVEIAWAFCQTDKVGNLPLTVNGLKNNVALINPNRASKFQKLVARVQYRRGLNSYLEKNKDQLRQLKPDVIHFHFASLAVRYLSVVESLKIPFTFSVRGADIQTDPVVYGESYISALQQVVHKASAIHAVTYDLEKTLSNYCRPSQEVTVIRTSIDPSWKEIKRNPKRYVFVAVGRLHWRKGFSDLLIACSLLKLRIPDFRLVIIGEGPQREMLEFMIRDLKLEEYVELVGNKTHEEIREYFSEAYALVLSSIEEGFPNVIGEAMLARVPVVSTKLAGIVEVLEPEACADLVSVGDPVDLSEAMMRISNMKASELQSRVQKSFLQGIKLFDQKLHADKFRDFWYTAATVQ